MILDRPIIYQKRERPTVYQKRPTVYQKRPTVYQKRPIVYQKSPANTDIPEVCQP